MHGKFTSRSQTKRADYFKPIIPLALIDTKGNAYGVGDEMQQDLDCTE